MTNGTDMHRTRRALRATSAALTLAVAALAHGGSYGWEPAGTLPGAKQYGFGLNVGGTVYAIGGTPWRNGGDEDGSVFVLNGATWSEVEPLSGIGKAYPQGGGVDDLGRIIVFGGRLVDDDFQDAPNVVYDPIEGPEAEIADPGASAPRNGFAFAADDAQRLYWIGGGNGASGGNTTFVTRYTGSTDTWTAVAPLPVAVGDACACSDGAGHLLVFGGYVANGSSRTAVVQRYDVATDTWSTSAVPPLPEAISNARAVRGADERIHVIGGLGATGAIRAEVLALDLATNEWSIAPSLAVPRRDVAAALGADDRILVIGGTDAAGAALDSVEALFTPTCPAIGGPPAAPTPWQGETVVLAAVVGGTTPMAFAWTKDGAPIADGPTGTGSTIDGATTATLVVTNVGPDDDGAYAITATNDCGAADALVATVTMRVPAPIPSVWNAIELHPAGGLSSSANGTNGVETVGAVTVTHPDYGTMSLPVLWTSGGAYEDLTPPGSVGGAIADLDGDMAVGWWWWPYQCYVGGQWYTCYSRQAARWVNGASGFDNLQASGWEYSAASVVRDGIIGGGATNDDESGNVWSHAGLWEPPGYHFRDLHPGSAASSSGISALDDGHQYGTINTPYPAPQVHAAMWSGTGASFVDMHPPGYGASRIAGAGDGQQVGSTGYYTDQQACLWSGSPSSYKSLHPAAATRSWAVRCAGGLQFGGAVLDGATRPVVWSGDAASMVDLLPFLPANYTSFSISDVEIRADGSIAIAGSGYDEVDGRTEALLLVGALTIPGDVNGDGVVGFDDLLTVLSLWGPCPAPCAADLDGDGVVGFADLLAVLSAWT